MVLLVGIINIPVSSFPERSGHFIEELTLRSSAQHHLSQTLLLGRRLLPQFLLVPRLSEENTEEIKQVAASQYAYIAILISKPGQIPHFQGVRSLPVHTSILATAS